jgi:2,3-diketo-5-methylthio-1-phosphopentane phosphatase
MIGSCVHSHSFSVQTVLGRELALPHGKGDRRRTVASVLVDFDGTACASDVASELCRRFAEGDWQRYDRATHAGTMSLRDAISRQTSMLQGGRTEMLDWVLTSFSLDRTFSGFVRWAWSKGLEVVVVSDGFGFYVESLLKAAGLSRVPVLANELVERDSGLSLRHPHAHPLCRTCGTCKMLPIVDHRHRRGPVAYCGDGQSDAFAAPFADLLFAKGRLADICRRDGLAFRRWTTFDDVRSALSAKPETGFRSGHMACPGMPSMKECSAGG